MRTRPAPLIPDTQVAKAPQAKPLPPKPIEPLKWYRVTGGPSSSRNPGEVGPFRRDQGDYFLKIGNEINSAQYDIRQLKNAGVKFDEIDPPGWWVQAQQDSAAKVEQLQAEGLPVSDSPPIEELLPAKSVAAAS